MTSHTDTAAPVVMSFRPPVNLDAERAVLAAVVRQPAAYANLTDLRAEDFADPGNAAIWAAIADAMGQGKRLTTVELVHRLAPAGPEHQHLRQYIAGLMAGMTGGGEFIRDFAHVVIDAADRRRILDVAREIADTASTTQDGVTAAGVASTAISRLTETAKDRGDMEDAGDVARRVLTAFLAGPSPTYPTGIRLLDQAMAGGLHKGRVYGFLARQKTGKTTLLATIAYNLLAQEPPVPVLYLSLEQRPDALMQMLMARRCGFNAERFLHGGQIEPWLVDRLAQAAQDFDGRGLYFRSRPRMSLDELRAMLARVALSGRVKVVILDYYQLVTGKRRDQSGAEHLDNVGQTLAEAAANYGLTIVTAAQVNRDGDIRGGDGLLNACDQAYQIGRTQIGDDYAPDQAWLEMRVTRYTPYRHVGTELCPVLAVRKDVGPFFDEL